MTEQEWLACGDPVPMLRFVEHRVNDRKLRLFAVTCCQLLFQTVHLHPWYVNGIAVAERFSDGAATAEELERAHHYPDADWSLRFPPQVYAEQAAAAGQSFQVTSTAISACWNAMEVEGGVVMADCASGNAAWAATQPGAVMPDDNGVSAARFAAEQAIQCRLLRDIIGNPFRPVVAEPAWLSPTVVSLATAIYADRAYDRLPILADALEDAGCTNEEILNHCRQPGDHVRGCWAVDLVLAKK